MLRPISRFEKMLAHARQHLPAAPNPGPSHPPDNKEAAQERLAIVLAAASIDDYFAQKFINHVLPFLEKQQGKGKGKNAATARVCAQGAKLSEQIDRRCPYLAPLTNSAGRVERPAAQGFIALDRIFEPCGITNLSQQAIQAAVKTDPKIAAIRYPLEGLAMFMERRYQIIHEGDFNARHEIKPINHNWLLKRLDLIAAFVKQADLIITAHLPARRRS
ncbi:MAG: hypothetical protein OXT03_02975 [Alphaproteobacteria bacterium]|nr:hypothetical protein [Alphaproteobacteria bacterium]